MYRKITNIVLLSFICFAFFFNPVFAQENKNWQLFFEGKVIDDFNGKPLDEVNVIITKDGQEV